MAASTHCRWPLLAGALPAPLLGLLAEPVLAEPPSDGRRLRTAMRPSGMLQPGRAGQRGLRSRLRRAHRDKVSGAQGRSSAPTGQGQLPPSGVFRIPGLLPEPVFADPWCGRRLARRAPASGVATHISSTAFSSPWPIVLPIGPLRSNHGFEMCGRRSAAHRSERRDETNHGKSRPFAEGRHLHGSSGGRTRAARWAPLLTSAPFVRRARTTPPYSSPSSSWTVEVPVPAGVWGPSFQT